MSSTGAFLCMIWDEQDARSVQTARRMGNQLKEREDSEAHCVAEHPGFRFYELNAFGARYASTPLTDSSSEFRGVIFGTVFKRSCAPTWRRLAPVPDPLVDAAARSDGRSLMHDVWGKYVAVLLSGREVFVLTDPTSLIPCFYTDYCGVTLLFFHLERLPFIDMSHFTINTGFVKRILAYDKIQNGETGINEVHELIGGQRLTIIRGRIGALEQVWDPRDFAKDSYVPRIEDAAAELRDTTDGVIRAWAKGFDSVSVQLSGGLDSSIVLSSLMNETVSAKVNAIHFVLESDDPSEQRYAEAAASHHGCELIILPRGADQPLPDVNSHPLTVRPYRHFVAPEYSRLVKSEDHHVGDAIFTGQGGDHLFLISESPLVFCDFLKTRGVTRDTLSQLLAAARLSDTSIWNVLSRSFPKMLGHAKPDSSVRAITKRRTTVSRLAFENLRIEDGFPEWARTSEGLPPVKFEQVSSLIHLFQIRDPLNKHAPREVIHALISQPLLELCLRLPTYLLCGNGISRGLARTAFSRSLPATIVQRVSKGDASRYFADQVARHRHQMVLALHDGELESLGLVSRKDVEAFLNSNEFRTHSFGRMIFLYYTVEAWLRTWKGAARH